VEEKHIAHLAGYFDAAGTVRIRVIKEEGYKLGYHLHPLLSIRRPDKSDPILGKLVSYCDDNAVRYGVRDVSHGSGNTGQSVEFAVRKADSVERFLEPMMEYLVTKYFESEMMIEAVVPAIKSDQHRTKEGFIELMGYADDLRKPTSDGRKPKYTQEYFEELWSAAQ